MKNILIGAVAALVFQGDLLAQGKTGDDTLPIKRVNIKEVVLSVNRMEDQKADVPYSVEAITSRQVELTNPQTSADMLMSTGNVYIQKSQQGGGSPMLRGFEASRVLLVIDGVRMNNAVYRSGHLQDAITVDNSMLERTEVLFGPSSVMYGSDALGGVVHFYTRKPLLSAEEGKVNFRLNAMTRYSTANQEVTGHTNFNVGLKKLAFITSLTYSDFGDLRSGRIKRPDPNFGRREYYVETINEVDSMVKNPNPDIQVKSGYSQYDVFEKIRFQQNDRVCHIVNLQYSNSSDIPRYDRLQEYASGLLRFAEWNYGPQKRMMAAYNLDVRSDSGKVFNNMRATLAYQGTQQSRISRRFRKDVRTTQVEDIKVYSGNIDFSKNIGEKHRVNYGLDMQFNDVASSASSLDIRKDSTYDAPTRYFRGGSQMNYMAAYIASNSKIGEKFILSAGLRFSSVSLSADIGDTTFFKFPFSSFDVKNSAFNGNLGLVYKPTGSQRFTVLGSSGYRAPNVDDMTKLFETVAGTVIVPNPDLKPELAYNIELGSTSVINDRVQFEGVYFTTLLKNAIVTKDFQYNGQDSILYDGVLSRVIAQQNANEAILHGVTANLLIDFDDHISFKSSINYTLGAYIDNEKDTIVPLDHIPPMYGQTSLFYRYGKLEAEVYARYSNPKRLSDYSPSGEDNLSQATPNGMPGWFTLNFKASVHMNKHVHLNFGIENIFDVHYRHFASGISAPGRNIVLSLRAKI